MPARGRGSSGPATGTAGQPTASAKAKSILVIGKIIEA